MFLAGVFSPLHCTMSSGQIAKDEINVPIGLSAFRDGGPRSQEMGGVGPI